MTNEFSFWHLSVSYECNATLKKIVLIERVCLCKTAKFILLNSRRNVKGKIMFYANYETNKLKIETKNYHIKMGLLNISAFDCR